MGHLSLSMTKSELLPFQKAIIAMSRAQYLAYLRSSLEDGPWATSTPNPAEDQDETKRNPVPPINTHRPADKLSVGVCIFRLDDQTLSPAVLLLRRSPHWWRQRNFTTVRGRHGGGEWELPGGKVENDDFSISAAIERLVREKTGLRVTKIMVMLSDVRWREELKVLLCEDEDKVEKSTDEGSNEDGDSDGDVVGTKIGLAIDMSSNNSRGSENADNSNGSGISNGNEISSGEETLVSPLPFDLKPLRIHLPKDSSSSSSSSSGLSGPRLTTGSGSESGSSAVPPPPVPPKDPGRFAWVYREHGGDDDDENHADHERDNDYHRYESDEDHDPSLKPAPLSLPSRKLQPPGRRRTGSSATLPASMARVHWRDAQVIPYKMVWKEYVQLNFTVLVDENPDEEPLSKFRRPRASSDGKGVGGEGKGEKEGEGGEEVEEEEHDALQWATWAGVEKLPMNEDLRQVVFEGLAWIKSLAGGFF